MRKKIKRDIRNAGIYFAAFLVLLVCVKLIDVKPIAPDGSGVGFAWLNGGISKMIGYHQVWHVVSELFGYFALITGAGFAAAGVYQLVTRKSIKKVDADILVLGGTYILTGIFYVLFEIFVVNVRPVLENGKAEASFPSSHTLLAVVLLGTAQVMAARHVENMQSQRLLQTIALALIALIILTRILSGVHWITDIVAGSLLGMAILSLYEAALCIVDHRKKEQ